MSGRKQMMQTQRIHAASRDAIIAANLKELGYGE